MFEKIKGLFLNTIRKKESTAFSTAISLKQGVLTCHINGGADTNDKQLKYFFYLVKNGSTIAKHGWTESASHSWALKETGNYRVRGFVDNGAEKRNCFSVGVDFFDDAFEQDWAELKIDSETKTNELLDLDFVDTAYPHQSFLLVKASESSLRELQLPLKEQSFSIGDSMTLYSITGSTDVGDARALLSGNAFVDGKFIHGQNDVAQCSIAGLMEAYGDYTAVVVDKQRVTITNDYFGVQKVYYLQTEDGFLISNRHHLLITAAVKLGIKLALDKTTVQSHLISGAAQPFAQTLSNDSVVQGVKILPVHNRIVISETGMSLEEKSIADLLFSQRCVISESDYLTLLNKGKEDVVKNLQAIFNHPRFSNVLVDLTGGMDSRAVFGALNNIVGAREKARINSCDTASLPDDQKIAVTINNAFGYKYDDITEEFVQQTNSELLNEYYSHLAGIYYAYDPKNIRCQTVRLKDTINVTGFFGEICLRPYYSRSYLESLSELGLAEFVDKLVDQHSLSTFGGKEALAQFKSIMFDAFSALPGESALEKYDLHYLYFRNGLHCSDIYRLNKKTPRVGILQSKHLMNLKLNTYGRISAVKLENDFIACLNPLLACFPYDTEKDNSDKQAAQTELVDFDPRLNGVKFPINADNQALLAARAAKQQVTLGQVNDKSRHDLDAIALQAVKELMKHPEVVDETVLKAVFAQLKTQGSNYILVNKVISVCQHARLLQQAG